MKITEVTDRLQEVRYLVAEITETKMKPHTRGQTLLAQLVQHLQELWLGLKETLR
jgi:hypothetical protein